MWIHKERHQGECSCPEGQPRKKAASGGHLQVLKKTWNRSILMSRRGNQPASTLNLQTWGKIKLCSSSHQFIVFCYRSSRKLIQTRRKIPKLFIWREKEDIASCVDKWLYLWKNHFIYHQSQFKTLFYSYQLILNGRHFFSLLRS